MASTKEVVVAGHRRNQGRRRRHRPAKRCHALDRLAQSRCLPQQIIDEALVRLSPEEGGWAAAAAHHRLLDHRPRRPDDETLALVRQMTPEHREGIAREVLDWRDSGETEPVRAAVWLLDLNQDRSVFLYDWVDTTVASLKVEARQTLGALWGRPPDDFDATVELRGLKFVARGRLAVESERQTR
jgi:hypothetical protein